MQIEDLVGRGYFPKELPPVFSTEKFARELIKIETDWTSKPKNIRNAYRNSYCTPFSIPKLAFSRKLIGIPNPLHQTVLSRIITNNWNTIEALFKKSRISYSKPEFDLNCFRAVTTKEYSEFKKARLALSGGLIYELRTDVSRFYPTIYTHALPWAIHTKRVAKSDYGPALWGNTLDAAVRNTQGGQTAGIPIGPDTSLILAEILACAIDSVFQKKCRGLKGGRFYDDYFFYFSKQADAEHAMDILQSLFTAYQLEINEEKSRIMRLPSAFDDLWAIELNSCTIREETEKQAHDLLQFFSLAFERARQYPKDPVLRFAVNRIKEHQINSSIWPLYQSLLLKTLVAEPATFPDIAQTLIAYKVHISADSLQPTIEHLIKTHCLKGHHFEVAWALWCAKEFGTGLPSSLLRMVLDSDDDVSRLLVLDLYHSGLSRGRLSLANLNAEFTLDALMGEHWLFVYEAAKRHWVPGVPIRFLNKHPYFSLLKSRNIMFYKPSAKLAPLLFSASRY